MSPVSRVLTPEISLDPEPLGAAPQALMGGGVLVSWKQCKGGTGGQLWIPQCDTAHLQGPLPAKALRVLTALTFRRLVLGVSGNLLSCWAPSTVLVPQSCS